MHYVLQSHSVNAVKVTVPETTESDTYAVKQHHAAELARSRALMLQALPHRMYVKTVLLPMSEEL